MDGCVVRLRGLPWSSTPEEVVKFFDESVIAGGLNGVHLTISREGRASGEAFVEFASEEDVQRALEKNKSNMGSRYVEVFRSKKSEMDWVVKRAGADHSNMTEACVKLRGLPFGCSKEEIAQFFSGLEIVPNGIMLPEDRLGRSTGEAFVQFASQDIAEGALGKHKERIGHRYIEIFKSCLAEANAVTGRDRGGRSGGRPGPYDRSDRFAGAGGGPMNTGFNRGGGRGGRNVKGFYEEEGDDYNGSGFGYGGGNRARFGNMDDGSNSSPGSQYMSKTGHSVHMRGLPFQAQEQDVFEFFAPIQPVRVIFDYTSNGRPSGEANVDFATHQESMEAMKKHKTNMQHRYIELFLNSTMPRNESQEGSYGNSSMGSGYAGNNVVAGNGSFGNDGSNYGGGSNMGAGFNSNMGGGSNMGGYYDSQGGQQYNSSSQQYSSNSQPYGSSSMDGNGYMGGSNSQSSSYGHQGMSGGYSVGGSGSTGGYSSMGSSTMSNLANPNYTAF